jgi:cob(I)alamin adenosyltransferase
LAQGMQKEEIDEQIVKYINRLSDLFFTIARFVNFLEKQKETIWRKQ